MEDFGFRARGCKGEWPVKAFVGKHMAPACDIQSLTPEHPLQKEHISANISLLFIRRILLYTHATDVNRA